VKRYNLGFQDSAFLSGEFHVLAYVPHKYKVTVLVKFSVRRSRPYCMYAVTSPTERTGYI